MLQVHSIREMYLMEPRGRVYFMVAFLLQYNSPRDKIGSHLNILPKGPEDIAWGPQINIEPNGRYDCASCCCGTGNGGVGWVILWNINDVSHLESSYVNWAAI